MLWNLFVSIALPITVLVWLWTDTKIQTFVSLELKFVASFVTVFTLFIGIIYSIYGKSREELE